MRGQLAVAISLTAAPFGAAASEIGSVAAANQAVIGTPPGAQQRQLQLGTGVVTEERIETAAIGAGQLVFLEQTTLTVWPNSDIVLDRYVYDPDRGVGEMGATMTRGVLRFIGGRITKTTEATVATPHGIVSIRGGIAQIEVGEESTRVVHIAGDYTRLGGVTLSRPNAVAVATRDASGTLVATFDGLLSGEPLAVLLGLAPGRGTGGLAAAPEAAVVTEQIVQSGLEALGSGDASAPTAPPVSTQGAVRRAAEDEASPEAVGRLARQVLVLTGLDLREIATEINGVSPPPPPPPPPPGALPDFRGIQFTALDTPFVNEHVVFDASNFEPLSMFLRAELTLPDGSTAFEVLSVAADGSSVTAFRESDGFASGDGFVQPIDGVFRSSLRFAFDDPGVFYIEAFRQPANISNPFRKLRFFGEPTPTALWTQTSGDDIAVRSYDSSYEVFQRFGEFVETLPLPVSVANRFALPDPDGGAGFALIPAPNTPLLQPEAADGGARWLSAFLRIDGEGPTQASALGVYTARAFLNDAGQPNANSATMRITSQTSGPDGIGFARLPYQPIDAGAGETAFGAQGDYLVFGQAGRRVTTGPGAEPFDATPGRYSEPGSAAADIRYGDTRLAILDEVVTFRGDERMALALPRAALPLDSALRDADPGITHFLTGGYAAAATEFAAGDPYLIQTLDPSDVRFGFAPASNSAVAEFEALTPVTTPLGGEALGGTNLAFGSTRAHSAMATDREFATRETNTQVGLLEGVVSEAAERDAFEFRGALATEALVGEPTVLEPEFLRWGWWGGELLSEGSSGVEADRFHLGSWVAGVRSDIADVRAQTGSATYGGPAVGHVIEQTAMGAASYVERGDFAMSYDFGSGEGSISISGILGDTYAGSISDRGVLAAGDHYDGGLAGSRGSGVVSGSFFAGAGDPVAATAGRFQVGGEAASGAPAQATGIFMGDALTRTGP